MEFNSLDEAQDILQSMIDEAGKIVAFTGAGISTESGIPDFRSPNGLWSKVTPIQYDEFVSSEPARLEDWRRRFVMNVEFDAAEPNEGHKALVRLQERGKLAVTITQNIDGMHQKSGLDRDRVIEIHGNSTHGACLDCEATATLATVRKEIEETGQSPRCERCGGLVKAAVISFGQAMPVAKMERAIREAHDCDLFLVLGSSLVVYPAASLPQIAKQGGAELVIINRDPTPHDGIADMCVNGEIGAVMKRIA